MSNLEHRRARHVRSIGFAIILLAICGCDERVLSVHEAARSGDADDLRELILAGANGDELEEALFIAASAGHTDVVELLIRSGIDPEVRLSGVDATFSALALSVCQQRMETAKLLMRSGANADIRGAGYYGEPNNCDPILVAFALLDDVEGAKLAIGAGANLDIRSGPWLGDRTALQVAAYRGNLALVQLLMDAGASLRGVMSHAARAGQRDIVALLLRSGADPGAALIAAAGANRMEVVDLLLSLPRLGESQIDLALESAAYKGHLDMVNTLLKEGANANFGIGPAVNKRQRAILDRLLSAGADASFGVVQAAKVRSTKTIELLLARGADPDFRCTAPIITRCVPDEEGVSAIMLAISGGHFNWWLVWQRAALAKGRSGMFNISSLLSDPFDMYDENWYSIAIDEEKLNESDELVQIVDALLEAGADPNAEDGLGQTALMRAAGFGFTNVMAMLIDGGADVNHRDDAGLTALDLATRELQPGRETLLFGDRLAGVAELLSGSAGVGGGI